LNKEKHSTGQSFLTVGIIGRTRGNKGELFVQPTGKVLTNLEKAREAYLLEERTGLRISVRIERLWMHNQRSIIKFEGIETISEAEKFTGYRLELPIDHLKPLEDGEYYVKDLIGLEVRLLSGRKLGKIVKLIPTGGKDVMVIEGERGEIMIPFAEAFIEQVDFAGKAILVSPPDGLLDIYEV